MFLLNIFYFIYKIFVSQLLHISFALENVTDDVIPRTLPSSTVFEVEPLVENVELSIPFPTVQDDVQDVAAKTQYPFQDVMELERLAHNQGISTAKLNDVTVESD